LKEEGFDVVAAAPRDKYSERIRELGFSYVEVPIDNKGTNPLRDMILIIRLWQLFRRERPDIILSYTPKPNIYSSLAAGMLSIPNIPNISGLGNVFIRQSMVTCVVKQLYRIALRFPPIVFFQNYDDLNLFVQQGLVQSSRTRRIPGSGIDTAFYEPGLKPSSYSKQFVFLLVGRMLWDKGIGEFVEAARMLHQQYPSAVFRLLGFLDVDNPQAVSRSQMQLWVDEGVIEYAGESDDVKSHILESECVVLPSYREGLPRTLLEGACMARPLIATDVPGCRDVIEDGETGYLCAVRNAKDLAKKMADMLSLSEQEREEMGALGRKKVIREFDEGIVIDMYVEEVQKYS